jgi:excisionase family DNA binding protein
MSQTNGYSVADAAKALGVSTRTIRRHLKEGKLPFTKINGQFGEEYRITELPDAQKKAEPQLPSAELSGAVALNMIRRLEEENRNLAGQLGAAHEKIRNLEDRIKLLPQPNIPWWRRLFGKTH